MVQDGRFGVKSELLAESAHRRVHDGGKGKDAIGERLRLRQSHDLAQGGPWAVWDAERKALKCPTVLYANDVP
jgi:hypothetical protein